MQVVAKFTLRSILGMRNLIANMCGAGKFE